MHLLGEGFVLDIFRMGELIAPTDVEKRIFRMCMQDEARHVAYGTMHLRYAIEKDPDVAEEIHAALDHGEQVLIDFGTAPDVSTALAVLLAGGTEHIEDKGFPLSSNCPSSSSRPTWPAASGPGSAGWTAPPSPSTCWASTPSRSAGPAGLPPRRGSPAAGGAER